MSNVTMINHYANPAFKAEEEALRYFEKETADQYKGFKNQLEQLKVRSLHDCIIFLVWNRNISERECVRPLHGIYWIFWRSPKDGWFNGTIKEEFD